MHIPVIIVIADETLKQRFVSTTFERAKEIVRRDLALKMFVAKIERDESYKDLGQTEIFLKLSENYGSDFGITMVVFSSHAVGGHTMAPCCVHKGGRIIMYLAPSLNRRTNGLAMAHEFGHALGAIHVDDNSIMDSPLPIRKGQGFSEVSKEQIKRCLESVK